MTFFLLVEYHERGYLCNAPGKRADGTLQVSVARHNCGDHGGDRSKYGIERKVARVKRSRTASQTGLERVEIEIGRGEEGGGKVEGKGSG